MRHTTAWARHVKTNAHRRTTRGRLMSVVDCIAGISMVEYGLNWK